MRGVRRPDGRRGRWPSRRGDRARSAHGHTPFAQGVATGRRGHRAPDVRGRRAPDVRVNGGPSAIPSGNAVRASRISDPRRSPTWPHPVRVGCGHACRVWPLPRMAEQWSCGPSPARRAQRVRWIAPAPANIVFREDVTAAEGKTVSNRTSSRSSPIRSPDLFIEARVSRRARCVESAQARQRSAATPARPLTRMPHSRFGAPTFRSPRRLPVTPMMQRRPIASAARSSDDAPPL